MARKRSMRLFGTSLLALLPLMAAHESTDTGSRPGPPLQVKTVNGGIVQVQRLKGKVVLLDFMTTVCPSCSMASTGLQKLFLELGPKGFHPIGIALNVDSASALNQYGRDRGLTFPLGTVPRAEVGAYLQHPPDKPFLVPTLALIDRKGRIRLIEVGWKGEEHLRAEIVKLLAQ